MNFKIVVFIFLILFFYGCNENKNNSNEKRTLKMLSPFFKGESAYENEILKIETDKNLTEVTSLNYINSNGKPFIVKGFVDNQMNLRKLIYGNTYDNGNESIITFYYIGSRKFASINEYTHSFENKFHKKITKSFYDDSSKVFFSKFSNYNDQTNELTPFKKCKISSHDDSFALKIINQQGEFQTNFQGFTENMGRYYLLLGTDNYTSAVAFSNLSGILKLLKDDEKKYLGRNLIVDFKIVTEANGFTYQEIKTVKFAN